MQFAHPHVLLRRGLNILNELFDCDFEATLEDAGATKINWISDATVVYLQPVKTMDDVVLQWSSSSCGVDLCTYPPVQTVPVYIGSSCDRCCARGCDYSNSAPAVHG